MAQDIETSTIAVGAPGADLELRAHLARPAGGSDAGVLLLPWIAGVGAQLRELAGELARAGLTALAWDPWHGPSIDDTPRAELAEKMLALDDTRCQAEQRLLLDHLLGDLGCTSAGVIGWCLGGRQAVLLAGTDPRVTSAVVYHPTIPNPPAPNHTLDPFALAANTTAPVLLLHAGADTLTPMDSFHRLREALESRSTGPTLVHLYPGAEHGFIDKARHGDPVNANAFALAWPQTLAFLTASHAVLQKS